jgi:chemotaxis protein MotB
VISHDAGVEKLTRYITREIQKGESIMQTFKTTILIVSLAALAGCANWEKSSVANYNYDKSPICPKTHGWLAWPDDRCNPVIASEDPAARVAALETERQRLADELAGARKQNGALSSRMSDLERQLADRDREIASLRADAGNSAKLASQLSSTQGTLTQSQQQLAAANTRNADLEAQLAAQLAAMGTTTGDKDKLAAELAASKQQAADLEKQLADDKKELAGLRGELSAEMAKLKEASRGLVRALRPEIEKGDITVDLNSERLMINLASSYLFGSGQDELKPAGVDALKQVGAILKDYPEYKVAVDGHTDNRPIQGALKKKFLTNKELSESRAVNAAKALTEGGLGAATTHGYADAKPVEPNTSDAGRAKNRRVEVRVTT